MQINRLKTLVIQQFNNLAIHLTFVSMLQFQWYCKYANLNSVKFKLIHYEKNNSSFCFMLNSYTNACTDEWKFSI